MMLKSLVLMIVTVQCPVYSCSHDCHCAVSCLQSVLMIVTGQCPVYSQFS